MKTIETKVYTFDELSDDAKEKARDWYRQGDEYPMLSKELAMILNELLIVNHIKCDEPKISYSLSCCQGDGAMFEGRCEWEKYTIIVKQSGHYYHYNSKTFDSITVTKTGEETADIEQVEHDFNDVYVKVCRELEKAGYRYIDYENSAKNVDSNIVANEYTFTSDGKRFG